MNILLSSFLKVFGVKDHEYGQPVRLKCNRFSVAPNTKPSWVLSFDSPGDRRLNQGNILLETTKRNHPIIAMFGVDILADAIITGVFSIYNLVSLKSPVYCPHLLSPDLGITQDTKR